MMAVVPPDAGLVPPNDLDAEAAVLSSVVLAGTTKPVRGFLLPHHFYSRDNARIYQACLAVEAEKEAVDVVSLYAWLKDRGWLRDVGGSAYIAELLDKTPSIANIETHARIIEHKAILRELITTAQIAAAEGYSAVDAGAHLSRVKRMFDDLSRRSTEKQQSWLDAAEVFAPMPKIQWIQRDLYLCAGRPTLWAGYGYSGKTLAAQSLVLSIASGRNVWGQFRVSEPRRVIHLDYEQGEYATRLRYQRLARGMGITNPFDELADRLRVLCMPQMYLTSEGIEEWLADMCEGAGLCVIDSLRATCPGIDENDSVIRSYLDVLTRVSQRTGCAFVVIHHAGKSGKEKDRREVARGSSGIFDACGTVMVLQSKDLGDPVSVKVAKTAAEASGASDDEFAIIVEDVTDEQAADMRWGLRVRHMTAEQANPPESPGSRLDTVCSAVLAYLRRVPGASQRMVEANVSHRREDVRAALDTLLVRRVIVRFKRPGKGGGDGFSVTPEVAP